MSTLLFAGFSMLPHRQSWLRRVFVGPDLTTMWRWLRTAQLNVNTGPTLALHPAALTVRSWLAQQQSPARS